MAAHLHDWSVQLWTDTEKTRECSGRMVNLCQNLWPHLTVPSLVTNARHTLI